MKTKTAALIVVSILMGWAPGADATEQWIEVRSPHFTVVSNAGDRAARSLACVSS